jgi:hypothetical protein
MANALDKLGDRLAEIFNGCLERGMRLPLIACAVSPNGAVLCMRVNGGGAAPDILAEQFEPGGFRLPMTCMVLDQNNEAARVTVAPGKILQFH